MSKYDGHTPGPWAIMRSRHTPKVVSEGNDVIAHMHAVSVGGLSANARLIADAPTLLAQRDEAVALLKWAREWFWCPDESGQWDAIDAMLKAREEGR